MTSSTPRSSRPSHGLSDRLQPVAVVVSEYNASITQRLTEGAWAEYVRRGCRSVDLTIIPAPGAFELPALCLAAAKSGRFAGVLALGCIIRGETIHDEVIAHAVANGLVSVTMITGVPACLGVLTVNNADQARARAGGRKGNKGAEAMGALLDTILSMEELRTGKRRSSRKAISETGFNRKTAASSARPDKAAMFRPRRRGGAA